MRIKNSGGQSAGGPAGPFPVDARRRAPGCWDRRRSPNARHAASSGREWRLSPPRHGRPRRRSEVLTGSIRARARGAARPRRGGRARHRIAGRVQPYDGQTVGQAALRRTKSPEIRASPAPSRSRRGKSQGGICPSEPYQKLSFVNIPTGTAHVLQPQHSSTSRPPRPIACAGARLQQSRARHRVFWRKGTHPDSPRLSLSRSGSICHRVPVPSPRGRGRRDRVAGRGGVFGRSRGHESGSGSCSPSPASLSMTAPRGPVSRVMVPASSMRSMVRRRRVAPIPLPL